MAERLPLIEFRASDGRSLGAKDSTFRPRKETTNEEGSHLNVGQPDLETSVARQLQQLDRRRRRGLIGRPGRKPHSEAASGGPRYSASVNQGPPAPFMQARHG